MTSDASSRTLLYLICVCTFVAFVTVFAIPPLLGIIAAVYKVAYSRVALLMTAYTIVPAVGSFAIGAFKDRYGARVSITCGLVMLAIAGYRVSLAPTFLAMVAFRVLVGIGATCIFVPGLATVVFLLPPERVNSGTGAFFASLNLGLSVALLATPVLVAHKDWEFPLRTYAALTGVVAAAFFIATGSNESLRTMLSPLPHRGTRPARIASVVTRPVVLVLACNFVLFFESFGMITFLPDFLKEQRGYGPSLEGLISMLLGLLVIPGAILAGWLANNVQPIWVARAGAVACALCPLLLLVPGFGVPATALLVVGIALGTSFLTIPVTSVLHHLVPAEHGGKITGLILTSGYTGAFLATYLCGWILSHYGFRFAFATVSLSMVLALVFLRMLRDTYRDLWIAHVKHMETKQVAA
jgi:predicted MFS family arabinose efflux permease